MRINTLLKVADVVYQGRWSLSSFPSDSRGERGRGEGWTRSFRAAARDGIDIRINGFESNFPATTRVRRVFHLRADNARTITARTQFSAWPRSCVRRPARILLSQFATGSFVGNRLIYYNTVVQRASLRRRDQSELGGLLTRHRWIERVGMQGEPGMPHS